MENTLSDDNAIDRRIAQRLRALRAERNWSLDDLAKLSKRVDRDSQKIRRISA